MSVTEPAAPSVAPRLPSVPERRRRIQPVGWWALGGAAAVALQAYVYTAWILSDDFRAIGTGSDAVPHSVKVWAVISQVLFTGVGLACVVWVTRQSLRARKLTFDAMLLIGWATTFWLDPVSNMIRPQVFFNSYYVNMGSWSTHIPFWIGPTGANIPNSLLLEGTAFLALPLAAVIGCAVMRWAKARFNHGPFALYLWGSAVGALLWLVMEEYMIRTGWLGWPGTIRDITLNAGSLHQMPISEAVLCGLFLGGLSSALRYFRDDQGRSFVERGVEKVSVGGHRVRVMLSLFAIIGFVNLSWIIYSAGSVPLALFNNDMPKGFPSYMQNEMCGSKQINLCPNTNGPIYKRNSPGVSALPGVNDPLNVGRR